jgi:predicted permease
VKRRDIVLRLRALFRPRAVERDLNDELEFHIERETQRFIEAGVAPAEAKTRARARFGSIALTADECRDARGTSAIDSVARDIVYAFRMFKRAPLPSLTIVATLGLGLGMVAVAFAVVNPFFFRVDEVPGVRNFYEFRRALGDGEVRTPITRPTLDQFRRETKVFVEPFAMLPDIHIRIDGRMMSGALVTANFFQAVGVRAAQGRALMPGDDDPARPNPVVVLSHRGWVRRFQSDPAVVGKTLTINGFTCEIAGVMPEGFRGLAIEAPDYWAPLALIGQIRPIHRGRENSVAIEIAGRLRPGLSKSSALDELDAWNAGTIVAADRNRAGEHAELLPKNGTIAAPAEALLISTPIFVAFGLILVIGCANVANLLLARGVSRQREIGIRLSIGATRSRVVRQLLTENLILALAAAALGFVVARLALIGTFNWLSASLPAEAEQVSLTVPASDWRVALFLVLAAVITTMFFALSPALQATRLELVRTMRGETTRTGGPGRARNLLIGIQVTASALLLTTSAIFLRSAVLSSSFDPGFRVSDTVMIEMNNEKASAAILQALESTPWVTAVSASWPDLMSRKRLAFASVGGTRVRENYKFVSAEHIPVLDLKIVQGRNFTATERGLEAAVAIVSEKTARRFRADGDVVGQLLQLDPDQDSDSEDDRTPLPVRAFTIVGVRRDIGFRIAGGDEPGIYLPTHALAPNATLIVRVRGDVQQARLDLLKMLTAIDPDMGQVLTMKTLARIETYFLKMAFWVSVVLGGLALSLTLSGLFSVLSYLVEQRAKEIGVRMALGANAGAVSLLVFSQTFRPVGVGLLIGTGSALAMALVLRSMSTELIGIVRALDPVAYAGSVFVIIAACAAAALVPARKAVRIDPIASLRQD